MKRLAEKFRVKERRRKKGEIEMKYLEEILLKMKGDLKVTFCSEDGIRVEEMKGKELNLCEKARLASYKFEDWELDLDEKTLTVFYADETVEVVLEL